MSVECGCFLIHTMTVSTLALYLAAPAGLIGLLPMLLIFGIFYMLIMRPQQTRQKKWQSMVNNVKPGDKVTTSGGLRGTVISIKDDTAQIRVAPDNLRLEIVRASIVSVADESAS